MKITGIQTLRLDEFSNVLWVTIHTDEGISGLGETFFGAKAVEAYIHETAGPKLLGRDPLQIERIALDLTPYVGFSGSGAETRGRSAIDVALWDLLGKVTEQPVFQLLGGLARDKIRTYNTCAGYRYVRSIRIGILLTGALNPHQKGHTRISMLFYNAPTNWRLICLAKALRE